MIDTLENVVSVWAPPPMLTVSQWADEYRRLSSEASAEPGRWRTDRAPYQRGIMDALSDPTVHTVVVMSSAQVGKALAIDTPVPTPDGWKKMCDIVPGDTVFGSNGKPITVLAVSPIFENRPCFSVTFSDGSEIIADAEHEWYVESDTSITRGVQWHGAGPKSGILTTQKVAETLKYGKTLHRNRYAIPVCGSLDLPDRDLLIDPYLLGVWLGDGSSNGARITASLDDCDFIVSEIEKAGKSCKVERNGSAVITIEPKLANICPRGHNKDITGWNGRGCAECGRALSRNHQNAKRGNGKADALDPIVMTFNRCLSALKLVNNKHIPDVYLRASRSQRLAVVQGLMDTDGYVCNKGRCEFVTTSVAIRDGMADLLSGLGIKYTVKCKQPTTTYKGKKVLGALAYRFSFLVYDNCPVFRMPRKLERLTKLDATKRHTETFRRRIVSVEPVESVPVKCIMVDCDDHLYLAGRGMVPTHNSEILLNVIGYFVQQDPSPILVLQPTLEMAEAFSKDRVAPMVRDTQTLSALIADSRSRDSGNTLLHKKFPGGHITLAGANSPASLASRPVRIVLPDEVDRYPVSAGAEGDPVLLAIARTKTFWNRKICMTSTPTVSGKSRIEKAWNGSDQRRYMVPCPECGAFQPLAWDRITWDEGQPDTASLVCKSCGAIIPESEKLGMIRLGRWEASAPANGTAGFHLNELYSPWRSWSDVVSDYLKSKDDPEQHKTWVNTSLGEPFEEEIKPAVTSSALLRFKSDLPRNLVPPDTARLVLVADTQQDSFFYQLWALGFAPDISMHMVRHGQVHKFVDLEGLLATDWRDHEGRAHRISAGLIDSGGTRRGWQKHSRTVEVYEWCSKNRVMLPGKGISGRAGEMIGYKTIATYPGSNKAIPGGLTRVNLRVDYFKDELERVLAIEPDDPGALSFHCEIDESFAKHYTTETRDEKGDWNHNKSKGRNDYFDCNGYAMALREMLKLSPSMQRPRQSSTTTSTRSKPSSSAQLPSWYRNRG